MGDMADYLIEQGEDAYFAHLAGDCDQQCPCQYCAEDERKKQNRKNVRKEK